MIVNILLWTISDDLEAKWDFFLKKDHKRFDKILNSMISLSGAFWWIPYIEILIDFKI